MLFYYIVCYSDLIMKSNTYQVFTFIIPSSNKAIIEIYNNIFAYLSVESVDY